MRTIMSLVSWTVNPCKNWSRDALDSFARFCISLLAVVAMGFAASPARADGFTGYFTITSLYFAEQNNFQYRVFGMPLIAACTNAVNWAYVNDSDPPSKGMVAAILLAYARWQANKSEYSDCQWILPHHRIPDLRIN
jgi:hypothetical protein